MSTEDHIQVGHHILIRIIMLMLTISKTLILTPNRTQIHSNHQVHHHLLILWLLPTVHKCRHMDNAYNVLTDTTMLMEHANKSVISAIPGVKPMGHVLLVIVALHLIMETVLFLKQQLIQIVDHLHQVHQQQL